MSSPNPFPCGGAGQRPCPPTNALSTATPKGFYTVEDMHAYGEECYKKGLDDGPKK
jgi:hypothetical protein